MLYPNLLDKLVLAQQDRIKGLQQFFDDGADQGVFNRINATLFLVQDDVVLRRILEPSFSIQYDLTLKQALLDFYMLKKYQLITPTMLDSVDDSAVERQITQIIQTIS